MMLDMAALAPGERVLDVACGTGLVSFRARDAVGPWGRVLGTDLSGAMVDESRRRAEREGARNIAFERLDAEKLAIEAEPFDAALCALGLMYFPDPEQALREMHRHLKPGGRAAAAVWGARPRCHVPWWTERELASTSWAG